MVGKDCVAIASDTRYGVQAQTVATDMEKVNICAPHLYTSILIMCQIFKMHDRLYVGLSGLATDMQTVRNTLQFQLKLYKLREEREIEPHVFANLVSTMLYSKRFRAHIHAASHF